MQEGEENTKQLTISGPLVRLRCAVPETHHALSFSTAKCSKDCLPAQGAQLALLGVLP